MSRLVTDEFADDPVTLALPVEDLHLRLGQADDAPWQLLAQGWHRGPSARSGPPDRTETGLPGRRSAGYAGTQPRAALGGHELQCAREPQIQRGTTHVGREIGKHGAREIDRPQGFHRAGEKVEARV